MTIEIVTFKFSGHDFLKKNSD